MVRIESNAVIVIRGFKIATWFWNTRGLSSYADQGTQAAFDQIVFI